MTIIQQKVLTDTCNCTANNFLICFLFNIQNYRLSKYHLESRIIWALLVLYLERGFE
jgi:hypothetical protein